MAFTERVQQLLPADGRRWRVRWLAETDSTNRVAATEAGSGASEGLVVVTDFQTAGRGRLDRRWEAPVASALLLSVLLRPFDLPPDRRHLVTAAVGLAAREACHAVGSPFPDLKWPNDLLVGERKLAGILAEVIGDAVVVGIGCNVSAAPAGAVCLDEVVGHPVDRAELTAALLGALDGLLGHWDEVADSYRRCCATVGRRVKIELGAGAGAGSGAGGGVLGGGVLEGEALAIDDGGRLVVRCPGGIRTLSVGDVTHVRPGAGAGSWEEAGDVPAPGEPWPAADPGPGDGHRA